MKWYGGTELLEETKRKISESNKGKQLGVKNGMFGKKHSPESIEKMRLAKLGKYDGINHPLYGRTLPEETKRKISKSCTGRITSAETRKKLSAAFSGCRNPSTRPEVRKKISESRMSGKNPAKLPEVRAKLSENHADVMGENNPNWCGGVSFAPYCPKFNKPRKEEVREEFGRICFLSGLPESENNGKRLSAHHCDYNKSQGCQGQRWSLLPLNASWHSRTSNKHNKWFYFCLLWDYWAYKYLTFHGMDIFDGPSRTDWLWEMYNVSNRRIRR